MVPRQETELVVDKCLEKIPADGAGFKAADVGTGSGILAVTLACERPALHVVATDTSPEALTVAARNAELHGVSDRIVFLQGNLCEPLASNGSCGIGLIVSNPPYVPTAVVETLEPEVKDHEPHEALDGGPEGLRVIRGLIPQAASVVGAGGWIVLELGEGQADSVRHLIARSATLRADSVETVVDAGGCERVLAVQKKGGY